MARYIEESEVKRMIIRRGWMAAKTLAESSVVDDLPSVQLEQAIKDCRNCKHGRYNDYHKTMFCYNSDDCTGWNLWEPTELPSALPETTKEYNLKSIYNIYVKIAQAHFVYQPSKPKTITAMPFDWIETQNLLEKYLKDHGADFDALCREYVSENVKDD